MSDSDDAFVDRSSFLTKGIYFNQPECAQNCEQRVPGNGCSTAKCFCRLENFKLGLTFMQACVKKECAAIDVAAAAEDARLLLSEYCDMAEVTFQTLVMPDTSWSSAASTTSSQDVLFTLTSKSTPTETAAATSAEENPAGFTSPEPTPTSNRTNGTFNSLNSPNLASTITGDSSPIITSGSDSGSKFPVAAGVGIGTGATGILVIFGLVIWTLWTRKSKNKRSRIPPASTVGDPVQTEHTVPRLHGRSLSGGVEGRRAEITEMPVVGTGKRQSHESSV